MMTIPATGSCQCGLVQYRVSAKPFVQYTCHCLECQKLTASAFTTCIQVPAEGVEITLGQPKTRERSADSGNRLTTSFCDNCGSALFAQNSSKPKLTTIFAGTLDRPQDVAVNAHIWLQRKVPWFIVPDTHRQYEAAGDWTEDYKDAPDRLKP